MSLHELLHFVCETGIILLSLQMNKLGLSGLFQPSTSTDVPLGSQTEASEKERTVPVLSMWGLLYTLLMSLS